jgi:predicted nucleic acid-binding protein
VIEPLVYLDASALAKLVLPEPESVPLARFLEAVTSRTSSAIARIELLRAVKRGRHPASAVERAHEVLARLALLPLDETVATAASVLDPPTLRTLDAIHLATALSVREALAGVVTYDRRLAEAARRAGLTVWSPR